MQTHDIDWFFLTQDEFPIHAASAGAMLPKWINSSINRSVQRSVEVLKSSLSLESFNQDDFFRNHISLLEKIEINKDAVERVQQYYGRFKDENYEKPECFLENYLRSFCQMAFCGFYSFDRIDVCDWESNKYQLIANPKKIVLSDSIKKTLAQS